jgi:hypothetical protein
LAPHDTCYFELPAVILYYIKNLDTIAPGRDVMLDFMLIDNNYFIEGTATNLKNYVFDKPVDEINPNHVVAYEQFKVPVPTLEGKGHQVIVGDCFVKTNKVGDILHIRGGLANVEFDLKNGRINNIKRGVSDMMVDGPQLCFWRPPTDNDRVDGHGELLWRRIGLDNLTWKVNDVKIEKIDKWGSSQFITVKKTAYNENRELVFDVTEWYLIECSGDVLVGYSVQPASWVPSLPKMGVQMKVSDELVTTEWVGYAQETYPDRKACGFAGHYKAPTDDLFHQYVRPQAAGNRMETRYVSLFNKEHERTLSAQLVGQNCQFSIYPYDDGNIEQAKHTNELQRRGYYTLNIDYAQSGLGTATCGPGVANRDLAKADGLTFVLHLHVGAGIDHYFVDKNEKMMTLMPRCGLGVIHPEKEIVTLQSAPTSPYDQDSEKILVDRKIGSPANFRDGWVGYYGDTMKVLLLLENYKKKPSELVLSFAHHPSQWVFMPQKVLVSYSKDGKKYSKPEEVALPFDPALKENDKPRVCILRHNIPNNKVKFIKIEAQPVEKLPKWHAAPGEKAWIMVDEIKISSR